MKKGSILITLGILMLVGAAGLAGYNMFDSARAQQTADAMVETVKAEIPPPIVTEPIESLASVPEEAEVPDYILNPKMEMPTVEYGEYACIGILEIPYYDLTLPVLSTWSYPALRVAPCRYSGSAYTEDLVIAAHNYASHFGSLKDLPIGETVVLTDAVGNQFTYEVAVRETLQPTAVEEMTSGEWDLTLFTCTLGGGSRVTIRCELRK